MMIINKKALVSINKNHSTYNHVDGVECILEYECIKFFPQYKIVSVSVEFYLRPFKKIPKPLPTMEFIIEVDLEIDDKIINKEKLLNDPNGILAYNEAVKGMLYQDNIFVLYGSIHWESNL